MCKTFICFFHRRATTFRYKFKSSSEISEHCVTHIFSDLFDHYPVGNLIHEQMIKRIINPITSYGETFVSSMYSRLKMEERRCTYFLHQ
jgi:hypothetical protein